MKLQFEWQLPIKLTARKKLTVTEAEIETIENIPGVYYFARNWGDKSQPFYIGESLTLRNRLKNHLKTAKILDILRGMAVVDAPEISNGSRFFHFSYFRAQRGQQAKVACRIAQRMMIRKALEERVSLLNSQLTVVKTHAVLFTPRSGHNHYFEGEYEVEP